MCSTVGCGSGAVIALEQRARVATGVLSNGGGTWRYVLSARDRIAAVTGRCAASGIPVPDES